MHLQKSHNACLWHTASPGTCLYRTFAVHSMRLRRKWLDMRWRGAAQLGTVLQASSKPFCVADVSAHEGSNGSLDGGVRYRERETARPLLLQAGSKAVHLISSFANDPRPFKGRAARGPHDAISHPCRAANQVVLGYAQSTQFVRLSGSGSPTPQTKECPEEAIMKSSRRGLVILLHRP